jgi:L-lactate dehydrogenase complex protein LldG
MSTDTKQQTSARNNILAKLKKEVINADYSKLPKEVSYQYPEITQQQQIKQFITLLEANHAQVIKLEKQNIATVLSHELNTRKISMLLHGKETSISKYINDVDDNIKKEYFDFRLTGNQSNKNKLFNEMPASITNSHSAIAATGSIVLWPTIEEPRSLSLVPPVHFVIVDANTIYSDFSHLIKSQQWQNKLPTNVVLISGPSKTADIQQTLAYGAHGPKELIVLLLNG